MGNLLPASFLRVGSEPQSPFFSFGGGVTLTLGTVFALGFLATNAEPALNVLGFVVQNISGGTFTRNFLVYSVCVGVSSGLVMGSCKILFGVPLIFFIIGLYALALIFTWEADEDFTSLAWDSAGVTTGPVTVPFVLSMGIGFSVAAQANEGFGILSVASVAPIITVLLADSYRRHMVHGLKDLCNRKVRPLAGDSLPIGDGCNPARGGTSNSPTAASPKKKRHSVSWNTNITREFGVQTWSLVHEVLNLGDFNTEEDFARIFDEIDVNKTGEVDEESFKQQLELKNVRVTWDQLKALMLVADDNNDGMLQKEEWLTMCRMLKGTYDSKTTLPSNASLPALESHKLGQLQQEHSVDLPSASE